MNITVSIVGNIGAGKSTLLEHLEKNNFKVEKEDVSNPKAKQLLTDYYENKTPENFLKLQRYMFDTRCEMFNSIKRTGGFMERCLDEDFIFLFNGVKNGIIDENTANDLISEYSNRVLPDLVIYLAQPVDVLMKNIKTRGRECEKNIEPEYISKLNESYEEFIKKIRSKTRILILRNIYRETGDYEISISQLEELINNIMNDDEGSVHLHD